MYWKYGLLLKLTTDLEYRPRFQGNGYFNVELMRSDMISLGKNSLSMNAGYKRFLVDHTNIKNQLYFGASLFEGGITLAYALEHQRVSETFRNYNHGILLQYYREFFNQLDIKVSGIYWFDEFQYSIRLNENLFCGRFSLGVGYERFGKWNELDMSFSYIY
jgi:hypothetical protein